MDLEKAKGLAREKISLIDKLAERPEPEESEQSNAERFEDLARRIEALPGFQYADGNPAGNVGVSFKAEEPEDPPILSLALTVEYSGLGANANRKVHSLSVIWDMRRDERVGLHGDDTDRLALEQVFESQVQSEDQGIQQQLLLLEQSVAAAEVELAGR